MEVIYDEPEVVATNPDGAQSYSPEQWEQHKPTIEKLYRAQRKSTADVRRALQRCGFHVNERMIKTRVRKWGLDKKHKHHDMRTAVALMARDRSRWAAQHPTFHIRGQKVTYTDILTYFRRKRIPDPIAWVSDLQNDGFVASPDVELVLPDASGTDGKAAPEDIQEEASHRVVDQDLESQAFRVNDVAQQDSWELINAPRKPPDISIRGISIIHPYQHLAGDQVIWVMRDYCDSYLESPRSQRHSEPPVHRSTTHASFAYYMQKGMSLMTRREVTRAFEVFGDAFRFIKEMFRDDHPMSIAMLMSIICELNKNDLQGVVSQLTDHSREMVTLQHEDSHHLTSLFSVLDEAGSDAANLALCSMRMAMDHLSQRDRQLDWKTLYLKERLGDCLYHQGLSQEGAALRAELLAQQEQKYGSDSRLVVRTLTNVADDDLQRGDLEKAEVRFRDALNRSDALDGYERANGRFKAYEGLAKTAIAVADSLPPVQIFDGFTFVTQPQTNAQQAKLREALQHYKAAETEAAMPWFEGPRRARTIENRRSLQRKIEVERRASMS